MLSPSPTRSAPTHTHTLNYTLCYCWSDDRVGGASPVSTQQCFHPQWWHHNGPHPASAQTEGVFSLAVSYHTCHNTTVRCELASPAMCDTMHKWQRESTHVVSRARWILERLSKPSVTSNTNGIESRYDAALLSSKKDSNTFKWQINTNIIQHWDRKNI